jgi:hypothetical protein
MKRSFIIPLIVGILASMACGLFDQAASPAAHPTVTRTAAITKKTVAATISGPTKTQEKSTSTPQPTDTKRPTSAPTKAPTAIPTKIPTTIPTDTPTALTEYVDSFDENQGYWSEDFIVTSQTSGRDPYSKTVIQDGALHFLLKDKETYMYKFFQPANFAKVTIEAEYQAIGHYNNGTALVCKVNEDRTQWYEARVSSTSDFSIYLYDKKRKTELGKNPYLEITKGKFKINELYPTKPNTIQFTCLDNQLILNTNRGQRIINQTVDTVLEGRGVGLGAMSYDVVPININFESVTICEED